MASSRKGLSPVVIGLLLVVLVVAGGILAYVFLIGAQQGFNTNTTGINATILPTLYSRNAKVGVYGDMSNFTISLSNTLTTPQTLTINITSNGHQVQGNTYLLLPSQTTVVTLTQPLNETGVWAVKVSSRGVNITSYYFQVVGTKDEADFAVAQWHDQDFYRNLIQLSLIVAITAFIISAASLARKPKTIIQAGTSNTL